MINKNQHPQFIKIGNWVSTRLIRLETTFLFIFIIGMLFRVSMIAYSSMLIILSLSLLSMIYYLSGFAESNNGHTSTMDKLINQLPSFGSSIGVIGILFGIQSWPGGNNIIVVGSIVLIIAIILQMSTKKQPKAKFDLRLIWRLISIVLITLILNFVPKNELIKYRVIQQGNYIEK